MSIRAIDSQAQSGGGPGRLNVHILPRMTPEDFARSVFDALDEGILQGLYSLASVAPDDVLSDLRTTGRDVSALQELATVPVEILDGVADTYIRDARRSAAVSGGAIGFSGWMGLPSGLAHLVIVLVRLSQRISLAYGFDYRTGRGEIEMWKALAGSVGADVDWEGTEAELMRRLPAVITGTGTFANPLLLKAVQAVVTRVALSSGLRMTRALPVVGAGSGFLLNFVHVDRVGKRLKKSYRNRHAISGFDPSGAVEVEIID